MFRRKIDGVIEAVRYTEKDAIDWVRFYESRGMAYSDVLTLDRDKLIGRLRSGELFYTGKRKQYLGNTFDTDKKVILKDQNKRTIVLTEGSNADHDHLAGVPRL